MPKYKRLKDLREDNDKTQAEIASELGIMQQQYARYETGKYELPMHYFITLAHYYNISLDYLAGIIQEPKPLNPNKESKISEEPEISEHEMKLVRAYRKKEKLQQIIDIALGIEKNHNTAAKLVKKTRSD